MKSVLIVTLGVFMFATTLSVKSNAQTTKKEVSAVAEKKSGELKVFGNCDMCKARIEKAAKIDGVTKAEWSVKNKTLTATFDPAKTNIDAIGKKIAAAGHDNDKAKASNVVYDKLPSCCQYR